MSIELKPFCHEAEVQLAEDFGLKLTINFRTIDRLEALLGQRIDELLEEVLKSLSLLTKFAWGMTREHHADLSLDQIAGLVISEETGPPIAATVGDLIRRAFNFGDHAEDEQSSRPTKAKAKRSSGTSRASSRSGSPPA